MNQQNNNRPIGYWLKRADQLLTERIDEAQRANGLTRLEWQALNVIREGEVVSDDDLALTLQPFADASVIKEMLAGLEGRGVIGQSGEGYELTEEGRERYDRALVLQRTIRQQAFEGISEADYEATLRVLHRLVENLNTPESTAIVAQWIEAANAKNPERLSELSSPDIEIIGPRGSGHGLPLLLDWLERAELDLNPEKTFADEQHVVVKGHGVWRSVETGELIGEADVVLRFEVRGKQVTTFERFDNLDVALEAAGLREDNKVGK